MKLVFSRHMFEKSISNFIKINPMGAELFCADGRTDGYDETNSRFSQSCEHASEVPDTASAVMYACALHRTIAPLTNVIMIVRADSRKSIVSRVEHLLFLCRNCVRIQCILLI